MAVRIDDEMSFLISNLINLKMDVDNDFSLVEADLFNDGLQQVEERCQALVDHTH